MIVEGKKESGLRDQGEQKKLKAEYMVKRFFRGLPMTSPTDAIKDENPHERGDSPDPVVSLVFSQVLPWQSVDGWF